MKNSVNGWLIIDKPIGITSNKVLSIVKRIIKPKKAGFIGTLDPAASGVLPVALGEATKAINFITNHLKEYEFTIKFGLETDTYDLEGDVVNTTSNIPSEELVRNILSKFISDEVIQIPPKFSAIKINGKRACDIVRSGSDVTMKHRKVSIYDMRYVENINGKDEHRIYVKCSQGTYVRSIAMDLAAKLGSLAVATSIKRLSSGIFFLKDAITLDKLEKIGYKQELFSELKSVDYVLGDIPVINISKEQSTDLLFGKKIAIGNDYTFDSGFIQAKHETNLVSIGVVKDGVFCPKKNFNN